LSRLVPTVRKAMGAKPTIVRNPPTDREFESAIEAIVDSGVLDPRVAQQRLRERYPRAVVRPRELAAEPTPVWYVYREGRWIPGD
jgi:hypothetical protein